MNLLTSLFLAVGAMATLQINDPTEPVRTSSPITISWTSDSNLDPTFSIELINTVFNDKFALANNVNPHGGSVTLALPVVPARDGYTIQFVNIGNIGDVYATSGSFSVEEAASTTSSSTSTSGSSTSSTQSTTTGNTRNAAKTSASDSSASPESTGSNAFNGVAESLRSSVVGILVGHLFGWIAVVAF
ncbi:hypothetical protein CYLTODRAFT_455298 [Cylindrobasidium torrendii FP15055 ss-10]|uniref:Yeast cell wall synthesis Kre9/Knh1-like N-terminal domain-containing protein n=1 Tax=Cylindrobasidium torrendii FP15055 ss-10 TaxID=1314674 RepID=A0A0D7B8I1_9AGAR|nr:hypothetical protein CYLTODRAFT_455298 [Cylindrobasidium torrendii FP15055 ss-10]